MSGNKSLLAYAASKSGGVAVVLRWRPSNPIILMYHGVSNDAKPRGLRNLDGKHIPVDTFAQHLKTLRKLRRVIPLNEMIAAIRSGEDLKNTVSITFDDGYENNYLCAAPILADLKMPATFFLTTGFIGTARCFWTDQLESILDRTRSLDLSHPSGVVISLRDLLCKRNALLTLKAELKLMPIAQCSSIISELAGQLKSPELPIEGNYRFMDWEQARALAAAGFEIGAHTENHPILSRISAEEYQAEILASRDRVCKEIGQCSNSFAYPNGQPDDYTQEIMNFCRLHFDAAVSTKRGPVYTHELYELRRLSPTSGLMASSIEWLLLRER